LATSIPAPSYNDEPAGSRSFSLSISREQMTTWLLLVAVLAVALFFNVWGLTKTGYGNTYYAAAVRSMTESWHNFFFGAFDPASDHEWEEVRPVPVVSCQAAFGCSCLTDHCQLTTDN